MNSIKASLRMRSTSIQPLTGTKSTRTKNIMMQTILKKNQKMMNKNLVSKDRIQTTRGRGKLAITYKIKIIPTVIEKTIKVKTRRRNSKSLMKARTKILIKSMMICLKT